MRVPFFLVLSLLLFVVATANGSGLGTTYTSRGASAPRSMTERSESEDAPKKDKAEDSGLDGEEAANWAQFGIDTVTFMHELLHQPNEPQLVLFQNNANVDWIFKEKRYWKSTNPLVAADCPDEPVMEWLPVLLERNQLVEMQFHRHVGQYGLCHELLRFDVQYLSAENHRDRLTFKFTMHDPYDHSDDDDSSIHDDASLITDLVVDFTQYNLDGTVYDNFWISNYQYTSASQGRYEMAITTGKRGALDNYVVTFDIKPPEEAGVITQGRFDNLSELSWLLTDSPKHYIFHGLPVLIRSGSSLQFSIDLSETRFETGDAVATYHSAGYTLKLVVDYTAGNYNVFKMILEAPGAAWSMQVNEGGHDTRAQGTHQITVAKSDKIYATLLIDQGSTL